MSMSPKSDCLPLKEDVIDHAIRPANLALPHDLFVYWVKKCWQFLDSAITDKMINQKPDEDAGKSEL